VTTVYRSAEECIAAIDGGLARCSLIVTDQTMPGMQGTDLIGHLRQTRPNLPVVLMSGYFSKIPPALLDGLGQVELLAKPFTTDELTRAVHSALTRGRSPQ
jgi:CheY-like chemotaxis protein